MIMVSINDDNGKGLGGLPRFQHIFANPSHARPSTGLYSTHFRYNANDPVKLPDSNDGNDDDDDDDDNGNDNAGDDNDNGDDGDDGDDNDDDDDDAGDDNDNGNDGDA